MKQRNYYASMMVKKGDADTLLSGYSRKYPSVFKPIIEVMGKAEGVDRVAATNLMITSRGPIFIADTSINVDPSAEELAKIAEMTAKTVELMGVKQIGIGSDLCIGHPDSVVEWMRNGKWTKTKDFGEGSSSNPNFPKQPTWFEDARGFKNLEQGLKKAGFQETEVNDILGNNWYNFYRGMNN